MPTKNIRNGLTINQRLAQYTRLLEEAVTLVHEGFGEYKGASITDHSRIRMSKTAIKEALKTLGKISSLPKNKKGVSTHG